MRKYLNYYEFQKILTFDISFFRLLIIPVVIGFAVSQVPVQGGNLGLNSISFMMIFTLIGLINKYLYNPASYLYPMTSREHSAYIILKLAISSTIYLGIMLLLSLASFLIFREKGDLGKITSYSFAYDYLFTLLLAFKLSPLVVIRNEKKWLAWLLGGNILYLTARTAINYFLSGQWAWRFELGQAIGAAGVRNLGALGIMLVYSILLAYLAYLANEKILKSYLKPRKGLASSRID